MRKGEQTDGRRGCLEFHFRAFGGETTSSSSRETASNYNHASVRRCEADARARAINELEQCACGLIATLPPKGEFALSRNFIHGFVVERVRG